MKARRLMICILAGLSWLTVGYAAEAKIGFVDIPYVIDRAPLAQEASTRLEKEFAPRQTLIQRQREDLQAKREKLEKDGMIMAKAQLAELERDIRNLERMVKRDEQDFREELNIQKNNEFKKVRLSVMQAINQVAKDEGFDLILSDGVLFSSKRLDITEKVLEYLEKGKAQPKP